LAQKFEKLVLAVPCDEVIDDAGEFGYVKKALSGSGKFFTVDFGRVSIVPQSSGF